MNKLRCSSYYLPTTKPSSSLYLDKLLLNAPISLPDSSMWFCSKLKPEGVTPLPQKPSNGPHFVWSKVQCSTYHGLQSPIGLAPSHSGCLDVPQTHQASLRPFALAVPSSQRCAGKYLTNGSEGENPQYLLISVYKCSPQG